MANDVGTYGKAGYTTDMFADFLKRLTQPESDELPDEDARLALTALLVRIARSDHDYSDGEKERIDLINARRYGLGPGAVSALREEAETLEAEAPDTVRFTRAIKEAVPYEERLSVVRALWEVVLADGARAEEEDALVRMAANFLGVSDRDSALARQDVSGGV
jgi:uncharacterized tellurite resistance protein B-like protein